MKTVIRQRKIEKKYKINREEKNHNIVYTIVETYVPEECKKIVSDDIIGVYDIETPIIEDGQIFLHDIQKIVKIKNKLYGSDNSVVCYIEDKVVETENSRKLYEDCEKEIIQKEKNDVRNGMFLLIILVIIAAAIIKAIA